MIINAYASSALASQVRWATGTIPLLCPPLTSSSPNLTTLLSIPKPRLLYLALHAFPNQPFLYGHKYITAITANQITQLHLSGSVIFAPCCHLADNPDLTAALLSTNPQALIAASGPNYAPFINQLGRTFRQLLSLHLSPSLSLKLARAHLSLTSDHPAALDTLTLQLIQPKEN